MSAETRSATRLYSSEYVRRHKGGEGVSVVGSADRDFEFYIKWIAQKIRQGALAWMSATFSAERQRSIFSDQFTFASANQAGFAEGFAVRSTT